MGLKNCQIQLDNPWNTYYAGQTINGQVILTFDAPKKVRGVRIQVLEYVKSFKSAYSAGEPKEKTYKLENKFIIGGEDQFVDMPAEEIQYNFQVNLSRDLPSTFSGKYGEINYLITAELVATSFKLFKDICEKEFKVVHHLDLNYDPNLKLPFNYKMQKQFYSITKCCTGPLTFDIKLPKTGFIPGDKIPINAECVNKSDLDVKSVKIVLRQRNNHHMYHGKQDIVLIAEKIIGSVAANETKSFSDELQIPISLQPISTVHCKYIFIHYELAIRLIMNVFHRDLRGRIQIAIGTVPIYLDFEEPPGFEPQIMQKKARSVNRCVKPTPYECGDEVFTLC